MLYHKDVYMPKVKFNADKINLVYGYHSKSASINDRYGKINLPKELIFNRSTLIEIEVVNGEIVKAVFRTDYNTVYDLIIVVIPSTGKVKTVWLNDKNDNHKTLDVSKYCKGK